MNSMDRLEELRSKLRGLHLDSIKQEISTAAILLLMLQTVDEIMILRNDAGLS